MDAPTQSDLPLVPDDACPRCGRRWGDVLTGQRLHLDVLVTLPQRDFHDVIDCYVGRCGRRDAAA